MYTAEGRQEKNEAPKNDWSVSIYLSIHLSIYLSASFRQYVPGVYTDLRGRHHAYRTETSFTSEGSSLPSFTGDRKKSK